MKSTGREARVVLEVVVLVLVKELIVVTTSEANVLLHRTLTLEAIHLVRNPTAPSSDVEIKVAAWFSGVPENLIVVMVVHCFGVAFGRNVGFPGSVVNAHSPLNGTVSDHHYLRSFAQQCPSSKLVVAQYLLDSLHHLINFSQKRHRFKKMNENPSYSSLLCFSFTSS